MAVESVMGIGAMLAARGQLRCVARLFIADRTMIGSLLNRTGWGMCG